MKGRWFALLMILTEVSINDKMLFRITPRGESSTLTRMINTCFCDNLIL